MMKKLLTFSAAMIGLIFLVIFLDQNDTGPTELTVSKNQIIEIATDSSAHLRYTFKVGDHYKYQISQVSKVSFTSKEKMENSDTLISVSGELHEKISKIDSGLIEAHVYIENFVFGAKKLTKEEKARLAQMKNHLNRGYIVIYDENRQIKKFKVSKKADAESFNLLKSIVLSLQVVVDKNEGETQWSTFEEDSTGTFLSNYSAKAQGDKIIISKIIDQYSDIAADGMTKGAGSHRTLKIKVLPGSHVKAVVDTKSNHLTSIKDMKSLLIHSLNIVVRTSVTTNIELTEYTFETPDLAKLALVGAGKSVKVTGGLSNIDYDLASNKKLAANYTLAEVLAQIKLNSSDYFKWFLRLKALLALNPELSAELAAYILELDPSSEGYQDHISILIGALGEQVSPQAMDGLIQIAKTETNESLWSLTVSTIGDAPAPNQKTKDLLLDLKNQVSNAAKSDTISLSIGAMAYKSRTMATQINKELVKHLVQEYHSAPDEKKQLVLGAIGNSGARETLPLLNEIIKSGNKDRIVDSVFELRRVAGSDVDATLRELIKSEDLNIRIEAAKTFQYRPSSSQNFVSLKSAYSVESDINLKILLLGSIASAGIFEDSLPDFLTKVKTTSSNAKVATKARDILLTIQ